MVILSDVATLVDNGNTFSLSQFCYFLLQDLLGCRLPSGNLAVVSFWYEGTCGVSVLALLSHNIIYIKQCIICIDIVNYIICSLPLN